jgi:hypothetical protein
MYPHHTWFQSFTPYAEPAQVTFGNNSLIVATGTGCVHVRVPANNKWNELVDVINPPTTHTATAITPPRESDNDAMRSLTLNTDQPNGNGVFSPSPDLP